MLPDPATPAEALTLILDRYRVDLDDWYRTVPQEEEALGRPHAAAMARAAKAAVAIGRDLLAVRQEAVSVTDAMMREVSYAHSMALAGRVSELSASGEPTMSLNLPGRLAAYIAMAGALERALGHAMRALEPRETAGERS